MFPVLLGDFITLHRYMYVIHPSLVLLGINSRPWKLGIWAFKHIFRYLIVSMESHEKIDTKDNSFTCSDIYFSIDRTLLTWHLPRNFAVNYDKCLMTRIQKMSLDYHFKVEQEAGSSTYSFFGFNGNQQLILEPVQLFSRRKVINQTTFCWKIKWRTFYLLIKYLRMAMG